jgi:hypothetical protein
MKVYILRPDIDEYRGLFFSRKEDVLEFNRRFDGTPMKNNWKREVKFVFRPGTKPKGDFPGLSTHIPVFNLKAVKALADLLEGNGELLPTTCDDGEDYFLFNVTRVIDALNEANCAMKRFTDGKLMYIVRHSFFPDRVAGVKVFKLPQIPLMDVFVTDDFVKSVRTAKLKGFEFRPVWSDEIRLVR